MAITAGVMIAGTIASSAISSHAATSAANTQSAAADKALGLQQQVYNTTQSQIAPYQQLGTGAMSNLQNYANNPAVKPNPNGFGYVSGFTPGQATSGAPSMTAPMGGPSSTPQMVTVQAPTGETKQMTMAEAQPFLQHGAKILGQQGGGMTVPRQAGAQV